ncbi:MAG: MarR family transcriptional regulator [Solirubrobacterales bacterium]|nr:MarR family transcriptional regulator [Solirubrobacterales bacterium]
MSADARTANVLAALALELDGRMSAATREASGLSASQAAALVALINFAEDQPLAILQEALGLSQPAIGRILEGLEGRGLVVRARGHAGDGRRLRVRVTRSGRRLGAHTVEARLEAVAEALGAMPAGSRAAVGPAVEPLLDALTGGRADARRICRLCEPDICGHPERCPVTLAADRAEALAG